MKVSALLILLSKMPMDAEVIVSIRDGESPSNAEEVTDLIDKPGKQVLLK